MHDSAYKDAQQFFSNHLPKLLNVDDALRVGDFGSADVNGTMRPFILPHWKYVGCDLSAGPNVDHVLSSPYHWPEIFTESFDVIVSSQTLEHVAMPWRWIREIARVLRRGGVVYLCAPNNMKFHEYPVDCWRIWPDGLRALFEEAGIHDHLTYVSGIDTTGIGIKII